MGFLFVHVSRSEHVNELGRDLACVYYITVEEG